MKLDALATRHIVWFTLPAVVLSVAVSVDLSMLIVVAYIIGVLPLVLVIGLCQRLRLLKRLIRVGGFYYYTISIVAGRSQ